jgi:hypothetical protein
VICGRGEGQTHLGTKVYKLLIQTKAETFANQDARGGESVALSIVNEIVDKGGRFLSQFDNGTYYDIGKQQAFNKVMEALKAASRVAKRAALRQPMSLDSDPASCSESAQGPSTPDLHKLFLDCDVIKDADVLIYSGAAVTSGTIVYRDLVHFHTEQFLKAKNDERRGIAVAIVTMMHHQNSRFFSRDKRNQWFILSFEEAALKAYQSLSERWLKNQQNLQKQKAKKRSEALKENAARRSGRRVSFSPDVKGPKERTPFNDVNEGSTESPFDGFMSTLTKTCQKQTIQALLQIPEKFERPHFFLTRLKNSPMNESRKTMNPGYTVMEGAVNADFRPIQTSLDGSSDTDCRTPATPNVFMNLAALQGTTPLPPLRPPNNQTGSSSSPMSLGVSLNAATVPGTSGRFQLQPRSSNAPDHCIASYPLAFINPTNDPRKTPPSSLHPSANEGGQSSPLSPNVFMTPISSPSSTPPSHGSSNHSFPSYRDSRNEAAFRMMSSLLSQQQLPNHVYYCTSPVEGNLVINTAYLPEATSPYWHRQPPLHQSFVTTAAACHDQSHQASGTNSLLSMLPAFRNSPNFACDIPPNVNWMSPLQQASPSCPTTLQTVDSNNTAHFHSPSTQPSNSLIHLLHRHDTEIGRSSEATFDALKTALNMFDNTLSQSTCHKETQNLPGATMGDPPPAAAASDEDLDNADEGKPTRVARV